MFLLVPAYPGSPGQKAVIRLCVCVCVCVMHHLLSRCCLCNIAGPHHNKDGCEDEDEEAIMVNIHVLLASIVHPVIYSSPCSSDLIFLQ